MITNKEITELKERRQDVKSTQIALIDAMTKLVNGIERDLGGKGLTWEQIGLIFKQFREKEPVVILLDKDETIQ